MEGVVRRAIFIMGLIYLVGWTLFLFTGAHSYLVTPPGEAMEESSQTSEFVKGWITTAVDPNTVPIHFSELEAQIVSSINEYREQNGLLRLEHDDTLSALARSDAKDMLRRSYRISTTPDGSRLEDRVSRWSPDRLGRSAEIVADFLLVDDVATTVNRMLQGWRNSVSPASILQDPKFRGIGIGVEESKGNYLASAILFEPVFKLNRPLPLKAGPNQELQVEATYLRETPAPSMKFHMVRESRGFFKAHVLKNEILKPSWAGNQMNLALPLHGTGMYRLEWTVFGVHYDRHPIEVIRK